MCARRFGREETVCLGTWVSTCQQISSTRSNGNIGNPRNCLCANCHRTNAELGCCTEDVEDPIQFATHTTTPHHFACASNGKGTNFQVLHGSAFTNKARGMHRINGCLPRTRPISRTTFVSKIEDCCKEHTLFHCMGEVVQGREKGAVVFPIVGKRSLDL